MGTTKLYHVRWRAGQSVVREHSFTSAPLAIAFFSLDAATCLGVLETDRLTIYTQDGSSYSAALPCKPHALWPLRRGLVIEPEWLVSGVDAPLLLIERPLDEPQPVDATAAGHFIHESTILRSDAPRSRLLAHDLTRRRHVLWAIDVTTTTPASSTATPPPPPRVPLPPMASGPSSHASPLDVTHSKQCHHDGCNGCGCGARSTVASRGACTPAPPTAPPPAARLRVVWQQDAGLAAAVAACHFITPANGVAPPLLFLVQPSDSQLYCYPLPSAGAGSAVLGGKPIASIPAVCAQPVTTSLASLVAASILVLTPTGQLELYSCADDGTLRCMHREQSPPITGPATILPHHTGNDSHMTTIDVEAPAEAATVWPMPSSAQLVDDRMNLVAVSESAPNGGRRTLQTCGASISPLVRQCLQVLRLCLAPRTYLSVLHATLAPTQLADTSLHEPPSRATTDYWKSFCTTLSEALGCRPPAAAATGAQPLDTDDWAALLRSRHHHRLSACAQLRGLQPVQSDDVSLGDAPGSGGAASGSCTAGEVERVLTELHILYESMKLDTLSWPMLSPLAGLLATLSVCTRRWEHAHHYARDFGALGFVVEAHARQAAVTSSAHPPPFCIFHWLASSLAAPSSPGASLSLPPLPPSPLLTSVAAVGGGEGDEEGSGSLGCCVSDGAAMYGSNMRLPASLVPVSCRLPAVVLTLYRRIAEHREDPFLGIDGVDGCGRKTTSGLAESLVRQMVAAGLGPKQLEAMPLGVALPLQDAIRTCRHHAPERLSLRAYDLIGRHDLAREELQHAEARPAPIALPAPLVTAGFAACDDNDGTAAVVMASALIFAADLRLREVRRLLCSSKPLTLRLTATPELSDHDMLHEQQSRLHLLCRRSMALPVGRGMFSLASAPPRLTEALRLAPLTLKGRMPSTAATIDLDLATLPSDQLHWPEFHNGAAAALRLCPPGCGTADEGELGRNWIVYNKPRSRQHSHAGFLLGLGLQGHLLALANTDLYRYMSQGHDVTMMAVLLGMAAARLGSMHNAIAKMLCLHIPSLHPPTFTELELEVPAVVQIAALMGVGLLYQGSAHRLMTEVMLDEISRPPTNELLACRESYALTAGLSLGMLALGRGSDAAGLADLLLEDKLGNCMHGKETAPPAIGSVDPSATPPSMRSTAPPVASRCCRIREGPLVNVDVTAAGATLALALIFLKSNNASVAAQFRVPTSTYDLHCVRPDLILLRIAARNLIMWDSVLPTPEWLTSQLPSLPPPPAPNTFGPVLSVDPEALRLSRTNSQAGACLALGLRFAGSCCEPACEILIEQVKELHALRQNPSSPKAEQPTLEACLGAAALALSLVMAGSGNLRCLRLFRVLRRRVDSDVTYGFHMAVGMAIGFLFLGGGRLTLGTSKPAIAALLAALFPRFPHDPRDCRYHLQAFRHLYALATEARCIDAVDVDSGHAALLPLKVALHVASSVDECAEASADATVSRIDLSESAAAMVPLFEKVAPCTLPPLNTISALSVCGPRYWPRALDTIGSDDAHAAGLSRRVLWVKRKIGHLSYLADPQGLSSMFARHFPSSGAMAPQPAGRLTGITTQCVAAFSSEPMLLAFSQHLCHMVAASGGAVGAAFAAFAACPIGNGGSASPSGAGKLLHNRRPASESSSVGVHGVGALPDARNFCEAVLYECLAMEKAEVLPAYLRLYHLTATLPQLTHGLPVHSVRMLSAYYASPTLTAMRPGLLGSAALDSASGTNEPLLQPTFIHSLTAQLDTLFSLLQFDTQLGRQLAEGGGTAAAVASATALTVTRGISDGQKRILYGAFLAFHGILFSHVGSSSTTGAELLPLVVATLATRASAEISGDFSGGDTRGLHATALRIAALGANESPWGERGGAPLL